MVRGDRTIISSFVALAFIATALTGCAGDPASSVPGDYPDLSLAASKSPVQLLRNDAASRIPAAAIDTVEDTEDVSFACLSEEADPSGIVRSWHSSARVTIEEASTWRLDSIVADFVESFTEQGWKARSLGGSANAKSQLLTSDSSMAEITVSALIPDSDQTSISTDENVEAVTVQIQVHGPCVLTDGADSDEVKKVEGR